MHDVHTQSFLAGGGHMGSRIRCHDWGATPVGEPTSWPQGLKTAIRILLSTGHPMFLFWGPELIQFYNDAYRRSLGPERHPNALGQRGRECWQEIWDVMGPQIEQVMAGIGHTWHENQLVPITRHGRREEVYWTYSYGPVDEPTGPNGVGGVLVICTETTHQDLSVRRLKDAEAGWRSLFDQVPGFTAVLRGPNHVFEYANTRYHKLVNERDIIGKPVKQALPEVESQGFIALLDGVYHSGEPYSGAAIPVTLAQGETSRQHYLDFVYQPLKDDTGAVTGILVNGYDVTERVTTGEALREQDRRKDEFLAMLAHELRNPLAPIRNASELLLRSPAPERVRAIGDLVGRQVNQLSRLVNDLLDVSRVTSGRIQLNKESVQVRRVVELAVESVQPLVLDKGHTLTVTCPDGLYLVADAARLAQAISNVLGNAAKFTPASGEIRINAFEADASVVVEVVDSGPGISEDMLPKIFELFAQGDRTLDRSHGGLGIGLAVVKRLVEMHGGEVHAASSGPGSGSMFTLRLPRGEAPRNDASTDRTPPNLVPKRTLVVDDNRDAADSLAQLLELVGHSTEAVYSAEGALARAADFDVVLLDIGLPTMNGYEVARRIRAREHVHTTIVALTGYGMPSDVQRALDAGFDAHLTKPVAFDALRRILTDHAEKA